MKVTRKMQFKTNDICVGDQITVKLKGFRKFTATAQRVTEERVCFLFDDVIAEHSMNPTNTNEGGFDESGMAKWLRTSVLDAFPEKLRRKIIKITLPSYGEIFGHEGEFYENFVPDEDERFELMKRRGNRVCDFDGEWSWWWLRNPTKESVSSAHFAGVAGNGAATFHRASTSGGGRPEFWLVR